MKQTKGFTLVEAAVAIGVVAVLSGIIIPLVLKSMRDAKIARARNDIMVIAGAIAHQLKDTGTRPRAVGFVVVGGNPPTGAGNAMWFSEGEMPLVNPGPANLGPRHANTFHTLFATSSNAPLGNALFGFPPRADGAEFGYKGPYLAADVANKTDPWGNAYVILGYNADGQDSGGPIWVVSAGEGRTIEQINLTRVAGAPRPGGLTNYPDTYPVLWDYRGLSETNIAVRVN